MLPYAAVIANHSPGPLPRPATWFWHQVPNLYAPDEIEKIVNMVRPLAKAAGKLESRDAILQHYVQLGE